MGRAVTRPAAEPAPLSAALFVGFAAASIGGPLALLTLLPGTVGEGVDSAGLVVALALVVFAVPLGIWLAYSSKVLSPGGLSAFVEAAAGRRLARAHGWIWTLAYFLYLPYTVTFVVYDLLEPVFPGLHDYRAALELVLPVALVAIVFAPLRGVVAGLGVLAAAQIVLLLVVAGLELSHTGTPALGGQPSLNTTGRATGDAALLFVCASLPLYLGAEVSGGRRTVRRGLTAAVANVGAPIPPPSLPPTKGPAQLPDAAPP